MIDLFDKFKISPLQKFSDFSFQKFEGKIANRTKFRNKEVINWAMNDYLGFSNNDTLKEIDKEIIEEWGTSYAMGSRIMSGNTEYHELAEKQFASFLDKESVYIGNLGYSLMFSLIDSLLSRNDVVIYDADCHACVIDGIRLHKGYRFSFENNNIDHLESRLRKASEITKITNGGILVISEGVFGMQGEQGKLKEIVKLKDLFSFRLLVDDAHGFGIIGKNGKGSGIHQGIQSGIDLYFTTFTKSLGSMGALVAGEFKIINYLKFSMRSQVFSRSLPGIFTISLIERLKLVNEADEQRKKTWDNALYLQSELTKNQISIGKTNSCITPIIFKNENYDDAIYKVNKLRDVFGVICPGVVYPAVPKGTILLRLIPTPNHTKEDINYTVHSIVKAFS